MENSKIKVGIVGYGNLGRGVELAIGQNSDMELVAVFTRREPETVKILGNAKIDKIDNIESYVGKIDVMILCGGSATDLPQQGPQILKMFNTVDSFDTHAKVEEYFEIMNSVGNLSKRLGAISIGWDPGLFSIARMLFTSFLPVGETYTFWGKGVSQGHSDAIRRIKGVKNAIQYTIPIDDALQAVRSGNNPKLETKDKHLRECFVVVEDGADKLEIEKQIVTMPNYFADYNTVVNFVSENELKTNHSAMPHGGHVIHTGTSGAEMKSVLELAINLQSNPEFTSMVLVAYARAVFRMHKEGNCGAVTIADVALKYLIKMPYQEILRTMI